MDQVNREAGREDSTELEQVLDFAARLGRDLVANGANIERAQVCIGAICQAYSLLDMSLFIISSHLSVAARDAKGRYACRQCAIPSGTICLEKVKKLNRLSLRVSRERPDAALLPELLEEARKGKDYDPEIVFVGQLAAMISLAVIFGGGITEVVSVILVTIAFRLASSLMEGPGLNPVIVNAVTMFLCALFAILLGYIGIEGHIGVILITASMLVIPGIPLVNAVRNLLCGNEMNGILQILKATVETMAMLAGMYLAMALLGGGLDSGEMFVEAQSNPLILILFSFTASVGFGIVFGIPRYDLHLAGLGSVLARAALILFSSVIDSRVIYMILAALAASLYAEYMGSRRRDPSTYFLYPAIIPLIPGDLFYYTLVEIYLGKRSLAFLYGWDCLQTLIGMSFAFVLSSIISHYIRVQKARHLLEQSLILEQEKKRMSR